MLSYTIENTKIQNKFVLFLSLLISILFFLFNLFGSSILFFAGIVMLLFSIFVLSDKEIFLLIAFLIPNLFMFKQIGSKTAILGYFFVIISIKCAIKYCRCNMKINLFFIAHIGFAFITCFLYRDQNLFVEMIRFCFNFSLFSYCATLFSREGEIKQVIKMYLAGVVVAIIIGIVYHTLLGDIYNGFFSGVNSGRNYFGAIITPAITIVVLYFLKKSVSYSEIILYSLTIVLCLISIVLSGSRTSILGLIIPVLLYLFCFLSSVFKVNKKLLLLALLIVIFVTYVYMNYYDSIMSLFDRFQEKDTTTGNGRYELWQYYIQETIKTPITFLFGCGSLNVSNLAEHNTLIQCYYQLGVVGCVTMFGILQRAYRNIINGNKIHLISIFPLLSVIIPYSGISGLYADQLSFLLVLCAIIMKDLAINKSIESS